MAIIDLSLVTRSLKKLLEDNINKVLLGGGTVSVTPEPPDKVGSVMNKISLFMYHVSEEDYYKNFEGPGSDGRNIARTPMGLCLFYILTPHHESPTPEDDPLTQQTLLGYALKTLHDHPLVHDGTKIDDETILQGDMYNNNNPMQIILRPVSAEEAISFWGAEDQQTARLSAYYEVRVVLLEPDEPTTVSAPVLSLGTYLYQLGTPHLERSLAALPFVLPSSAGGSTQVVDASPARVAGQAGADPARNRLVLDGHNLASGSSRQLWLRSESFTASVGAPLLAIDPSLGTNEADGWALTVADDRLTLDIHKSLVYLDEDEVEQTIDLVPGIYTTFVRVTVEERVVNNTVVPVTNDSNEVAFAIIPRIAGASIDGGANKITVTLVDTFDLSASSLEVRVYVDGTAYAPNPGTANTGEYEILNATQLIFHATFDVETEGQHPLRVVVNGAESAPYWIETSAP